MATFLKICLKRPEEGCSGLPSMNEPSLWVLLLTCLLGILLTFLDQTFGFVIFWSSYMVFFVCLLNHLEER